jgi:hypothetical protein
MAKQQKPTVPVVNRSTQEIDQISKMFDNVKGGLDSYGNTARTSFIGKDDYTTSQYDTERTQFDDMEAVYNARNANQSYFDIAGNMLGKVGVRALSATIDLGAMISGSGVSGVPLYLFDKYVRDKHQNVNSFWDGYKESVFDNSITDLADLVQEFGDDNFQQQYSADQRKSDGVSLKRIVTEGVPDAAGFILSAWLTGGTSGATSLVGGAAKAATGIGLAGKGLNALKASKSFGKMMTVFPQETKAILSAASKGADVTEDIIKLSNAARNATRWNLAKSAFTGSLGEASQEGRATRKEVEKELVENYMRENGIANEEDIDVFTRASLRSAATDAGVVNFAINSAILTGSNLLSFPTYFKRFQHGKRELGKFVNKGINPDDAYDLVKKTTKQRVGDAAKRYGETFIKQGTPESVQELLQTMSSSGVTNYYSNKFSEKEAEEATSAIGGFLSLFADTISSTEGLEGMIVGGLIGGAPAIVANEKERGAKRKEAAELVTALNNSQAKSQYPKLFKGIVDNLNSQKKKDTALVADDIFTFKNEDHKQIFDYMNLRLDLDREEDIKADIENLKVADPDILDELFGAKNSEVEGFSYADLATKLEEKLEAVKKTRDKINLNYTTLDQETKNQLMYFASAVDNFDKRENQIVEELAAQTGVSVDTIRETYKSYKDTDAVDYKDVILRESKKKFNVNPILDSLDTLADSLGLSSATKKSFLDFETEKKKTEPDFKTDLDSLFKIITGEAGTTSSLFSGDNTKPANSELSSVIDENAFSDEYKSLISSAKTDYAAKKLKGNQTRNEKGQFGENEDFSPQSEQINKTFSDLKKVADTRETYYKYYTELSRNPFAQARFRNEVEQDKKRYAEYISKILAQPVTTPAELASAETNTSASNSIAEAGKKATPTSGSIPFSEMPSGYETGTGDNSGLPTPSGNQIIQQPPAKPTEEKKPNQKKEEPSKGTGTNTSTQTLKEALAKVVQKSNTISLNEKGDGYVVKGLGKFFRRATSVVGREFTGGKSKQTNQIALGNAFDVLGKLTFGKEGAEASEEDKAKLLPIFPSISQELADITDGLAGIRKSLETGSKTRPKAINFYTGLKLANTTGLNIAGEIDLLVEYEDGSLQIVDFKSTSSTDYILDNYLPQLSLYQSLLQRELNLPDVNFREPAIINIATKVDPNNSTLRIFDEKSVKAISLTDTEDKKNLGIKTRSFLSMLLEYEGFTDEYFSLPENRNDLEAVARYNQELLRNPNINHEVELLDNGLTAIYAELSDGSGAKESKHVSYIHTDSTLKAYNIENAKMLLSEIEKDTWAKDNLLKPDIKREIRSTFDKLNRVRNVRNSLTKGKRNKLSVKISYSPDFFVSEKDWKQQRTLADMIAAGDIPIGSYVYESLRKKDNNSYSVKPLKETGTPADLTATAQGLNAKFPTDKWILVLPKADSTVAPKRVTLRPLPIFKEDGTSLTKSSREKLDSLRKLATSNFEASKATDILNSLVFIPTQKQYEVEIEGADGKIKKENTNYDFRVSVAGKLSDTELAVTYQVTSYKYENDTYTPVDFTFTGSMELLSEDEFEFLLDMPTTVNKGKMFEGSEFLGKTNKQIFNELLGKDGKPGVTEAKGKFAIDKSSFLLGSPTSASELVPLLNQDVPIKVVKEFAEQAVGEEVQDLKKSETVANKVVDNLVTPVTIKQEDEDTGYSLFSGNNLVSADLQDIKNRLSKILPSSVEVSSIMSMVQKLNLTGAELGMVYKNAIYLANKIEKGTEYHEAFHIVFRSILSEKQRAELLEEELRNNPVSQEEVDSFKNLHPSYKFLTNEEALEKLLEERLADRFQTYQVKKDSTSLVGKFFNYLKDLVSSLFKNRSKIDSIFAEISAGKFRNSALSYNGKAVLFKALPAMMVSESDYLVRWISSEIAADFTNREQGDNLEEAKENAYEGLTDSYLDNLTERYYAESGMQMSKEEYDNLDIASKQYYVATKSGEYLPKSGFLDLSARPAFLAELRNEILNKFNNYAYFDSDLEDIRSGASETANLKDYEAENNTVGGLDSINKKVTGWLDSIFYINEKGRKVMINVQQVHAKLITNLADSLSGEELISKLEKIAGTKSNPRDRELLAVLDAYNGSNMKKEVQLLFLNSYNKVYMDSVTTLLNSSMKKIQLDMVETNGIATDGSTKLVNENNRAALREYLGNFSGNFNIITKDKNRTLLNSELQEEYEDISKSIQELSEDEQQPILERMKFILEEHLGMDLSVETLRENYVLTDNLETKEVKESISEILKFVTKKGQNPFLDDSKGTNNRSRLHKIILSEMKYSLEPISALTYKDATNKNRYAITGMFEEKKRLLRFQRDGAFLREIVENDYFKFSSLFSSGTDGIGKISSTLNSIKLTFVNGLSYKKTKNNGKRTFKDFNSADHILSKLSLYEKGYISPFVHESGSTQTAYDLGKLFEKNELLDRTVEALEKVKDSTGKVKPVNLNESFAVQYANILKQDIHLAIENEKLLRTAKRKLAELQKLAKSKDEKVAKDAKEELFKESYLNDLVLGLSFKYETDGESFVYDEEGNRKVIFLKDPKHRTFNSIGGVDLFAVIKTEINGLGEIRKEEQLNSDLISYLTDLVEAGADQTAQINKILSNSKTGSYASVFQKIRSEIHKITTASVKKEMKFARDQGVDYASFFKATAGVSIYEKAEQYLYEKAVRSFLGSVYVNQMITGYSGAHINFKNNVDIAKRSKDKTSSGMDMSNYAFVNDSETTVNFAIIPDDISRSSKKQSKKAAEYDIIATDGAAYVTANFMKMYLKSTVGISPKQEEILDIIANPYRWNEIVNVGGIKNYLREIRPNDSEYMKALNTLDLAPKKSFVANPGSYDKLNQGGEMFKDASFFLSPELIFTLKNGELVPRKGMERQAHLLKQMTLQNIDSAVYVSSSKATKRNLSVIHPTDPSKMFLKSTPISMEHIKEQVRMESGKLKVVHGTQLIELADISSVKPEEREEYQTLLANTRESAQNLYSLSRKLITKNGLTVFANSITNQLESKKRNVNVMKLLSGETTANNEHKFKFSVDLPIISSLFEEAFSSFFGKNVNRQRVAGLKLTLAPSKGMTYEVTKAGKPTYNTLRRDEEKYDYKELKIHRYESGEFKFAEVLISEEILDDIKISRKDFLALSEEEQQKALQMIGYRIPTQAAHSILPIKVVGILPRYYGSVVYMNEEAVAIMGADYDIDSLFVFRKKIQSISTINAQTKKKTTRLLTHELNSEDRLDSWLQYMYSEKKFRGFLERYAETRSKEEGNVITLKDILSIDEEKVMLFGKLQQMGIISPNENAPNYYSPFQQQNRILELNLGFIKSMSQEELEEVALRPAGTSLVKNVADTMAEFLGFNKNDEFGFNFPSEQQESQIRNTVGKKNVGNAVAVAVAALAVAKNESVVAHLSNPLGLSVIDSSDSYEADVAYDKNTGLLVISENERQVPKQLSFSDVSSSSTDDAKENNAYKLNITEFTIKRVSAGIAMGLGITRSLLLNTIPIMKYIANFEKQGQSAYDIKEDFLKKSIDFTKAYEDLAKKPIRLDRQNPKPALIRFNEMLADGINFFKTDTGKVVKSIMRDTDSFVFSKDVIAELKQKLNEEQKKDFGLFLINQRELLDLSDYLGDVATLLLRYRKVNSKGNKEVGTTLADYQEIVDNFESEKEIQEKVLSGEWEVPAIVRTDGVPAITKNGEAIYRNALRVLEDSENYTLKTNKMFRKSYMSTKGMFYSDKQKKEKMLIDSFFNWFNIQAAKRRSSAIKDTQTLAKEYIFSKDNNVAKKINTLLASSPELQKLLRKNTFWKKLEITDIDHQKGIFAAEIKFPSYSTKDTMVEDKIIQDASIIFTNLKLSNFSEQDKPLAEKLSKELKTLREYLTTYELLRSGLSYKNNSYTSKMPASLFSKQSDFLENLRTEIFAEVTREEAALVAKKYSVDPSVITKMDVVSRRLYYLLNPNAESENKPYKPGTSESAWTHRFNYFSVYFKKNENRISLSSVFGSVTKNETDINKIVKSINSAFAAEKFGLSGNSQIFEVKEEELGKKLNFSLNQSAIDLLSPEQKSAFLSNFRNYLFFNKKEEKYELALPMVIRMSYAANPHVYIRTDAKKGNYTRIDKLDGLEDLPFDINSFSSGEELDKFMNTPEVKAYLAEIKKQRDANLPPNTVSGLAGYSQEDFRTGQSEDDFDSSYVREASAEDDKFNPDLIGFSTVGESFETPSTSIGKNIVSIKIPQLKVSGVMSYQTTQNATDEAKEKIGSSNPTSLELIKFGFRTRTTRSASEMKKYNLKKGDLVYQSGIINGKPAEILTRITDVIYKNDPRFVSTWNQEGWTEEGKFVLDTKYKDAESGAIFFEVIENEKPSENSPEKKEDSGISINSPRKPKPRKVDDNEAPDFLQKASNTQQISLDAAETILKKLSSKLNLPYSFVSGTGKWIGRFDERTGGVEINQNAEIGLDTPFHEFLHPFILMIQKTRPELYNSLIDQIIEEGKTLTRISELYPELSQEGIIMEAIVTKTGELAAGIYANKKEQSLFQKVLSEIKSIISSILGINEDFVSLDNATSLFDLAQIMNDNNSYDMSSLFNQNKETHLAKLKMTVSSLVKSDTLTFSCK